MFSREYSAGEQRMNHLTELLVEPPVNYLRIEPSANEPNDLQELLERPERCSNYS